MNAARSRIMRGGRPTANLTPMIDVVFQLIIFFMLAAQFSSQQTIELDLPGLEDPESRLFDHEGRAVINLVPEERMSEIGGAYRLGTRSYPPTPEGISEMVNLLGTLQDRDPGLRVVVRASRVESYRRVHPLLQALTLVRVREVDLAVVPADGGASFP